MATKFHKLKGKNIWANENDLMVECNRTYHKKRKDFYWEDEIKKGFYIKNEDYVINQMKSCYPFSLKSCEKSNIVDFILYPSEKQSDLIEKAIYTNACKTVYVTYKILSKDTTLTPLQEKDMKQAYDQLKQPSIFWETYMDAIIYMFYAEREALDIINRKGSKFKAEYEATLYNLNFNFKDINMDFRELDYDKILPKYDFKYDEEFMEYGIFINIENLHFTNDNLVEVDSFGEIFVIEDAEGSKTFGDDKEKGEYNAVLRVVDYGTSDPIYCLKIARIE